MIRQIFLIIFSLIVLTAAIMAQTPEQAILAARDDTANIKNRSIELEKMKREAASRPESDNTTVRFPEIKEDFEQIQKINSQVLQLTAVKTSINYAAVFKLISEINHRAGRLKSNLFSDESKNKKQAQNKQPVVPEPPDMKTLLNDLDKSLNSFVNSSLFQNINVINPDDSLKAQKDLETVIKVSFAIKEKAKNLTKTDSRQ